jgi:hypothetical protein
MRPATTADGRPTTARALAEVKVCRRMRCRCGRRGLDYRPYHDGGGSYRVTAACSPGGSGQEV